MRKLALIVAGGLMTFVGAAMAQVTYSNRPPPPPPNYYPNQPPPGYGQQTISCGSPQYRYYFCQVDVGARGHVTLQRQYSDAACIEGQTWGWNRAGIWVDKGCGGHFIVSRRW